MDKQKFYEWWFSTAKFCGCGNQGVVITIIRDYLNYSKIHRDFFGMPVDTDSGYHWLMLYLLDSWGFTEHGGGVRGSWLTDTGVEMSDFLGSLTEDEIGKLTDAED